MALTQDQQNVADGFQAVATAVNGRAKPDLSNVPNATFAAKATSAGIGGGVTSADVENALLRGLLEPGNRIRLESNAANKNRYVRDIVPPSAFAQGLTVWPYQGTAGNMLNVPIATTNRPGGMRFQHSESSFSRRAVMTQACMSAPAAGLRLVSGWNLAVPSYPTTGEKFTTQLGYFVDYDAVNAIYIEFSRSGSTFDVYGCTMVNGTLTKTQFYTNAQLSANVGASVFAAEIVWKNASVDFVLPGLATLSQTNTSKIPTALLRHGLRIEGEFLSRTIAVDLYSQECYLSI